MNPHAAATDTLAARAPRIDSAGWLFQSPVARLVEQPLPTDTFTDDALTALLPCPAHLRARDGVLRCAGALRVEFVGARSGRLDRAVARFETALQRICGRRAHAGEPALQVRISCADGSGDYPQFGDQEDYRLLVAATGVTVQAPREWGVLHGLCTLSQLLTPADADGWCEIACCEIDDAPRFAWRGVLIDVARHFISMQTLKRTVDGMALCKLNVLHLHLSDDQAFRFPSTAFPRLASEPHFSRQELAGLVAYAADRGVRVVPEIDMPGHCNCWLVAYPEWGSKAVRTSRRFGVHQACLDPSRESVYAAIDVLLAEVAAVFPDRYLHIGGDEVHPAWWTESAAVRKFMADRAIADVAGLQALFIDRVAQIVERLGRKAVGWDEVVHEELPRAVVVQSWRGATARDRALARGNDCVVSSNYYLDLFYPAEVHYRFDPEADAATLMALEDGLLDDPRFAHVAEGMRWTHHWRSEPPPSAARAGRVVGAEACLWGELVTDALLDVRLWSRLPALAERFWSPASVSDIADLYRRLATSFEQLAALSDIDVMARSRALLAAAGVTAAWWPLVDVLEPLKWYGRLLGETALAARIAGTEMPQSRPYDADTALTRVVDGLLPESLVARTVADLCRRVAGGDPAASAELRQFGASWQALSGQADCLAELVPCARLLENLGSMVIGVLDGHMDRATALRILDPAAAPQGEYLIAVVPALRAWVAGRAS